MDNNELGSFAEILEALRSRRDFEPQDKELYHVLDIAVWAGENIERRYSAIVMELIATLTIIDEQARSELADIIRADASRAQASWLDYAIQTGDVSTITATEQ